MIPDFSNQKRDTLYTSPDHPEAGFVFDERVADVFHDMINRSVPGYGATIAIVGILAREYGRAGTNLYDLGCSLGAVTAAMRRNVAHPDCHIIAVDNSYAMVKRCRSICTKDNCAVATHVVCADIAQIVIQNASVAVLNFTLQFIDPSIRQQVINSIYQGLVPGGILVVSEKILFSDNTVQAQMDRLHESYKRYNGYSEMEISRKRAALENVLIRETAESHIQRLRRSGFGTVVEWFRCLNFISLFAQK